jgi:microcin C transport system permease protein
VDFSADFLFSLFAELIANDKPLLVRYQGHWYAPVIFNYSESEFGGPFATPADYQDPGCSSKSLSMAG